jgi:hypothetical protein
MSFSFGRMKRGDMPRNNADNNNLNAANFMAWRQ